MYLAHKDGEIVNVGGLQCNLSPVGYGIREERDIKGVSTFWLEKTDIIKRSKNPKLQCWERQPIPQWYLDKRTEEAMVQEYDPKHCDEACEAYRRVEWKRRMLGVWFWNKGRLVYITGLHYMYIQYWTLPDIGHPDYRKCDRLFFYFLQYCIEDPDCLGMLNVAKRKSGKTARSGIFIFEYISRTEKTHGGIQSKTDTDAIEIFAKAVVSPWRELPDFFRPIYDTMGGDNPDTVLTFKAPSRKGKNAGAKVIQMQFLSQSQMGLQVDKPLGSWIDQKARGAGAYDGPHLHRYVSDEAGKLKDVDINKRHGVVKLCSYVNGKHIGKHLYTTTVEEIEDGGGRFKKLWDTSDHNAKSGARMTASQLYRYFEPSYTIDEVDIYGDTNEMANIRRHEEERATSKANDTREEYFGVIRRNAFTIEEAFKFSSKTGLYDTEKLYDRIDALLIYQGLERGNLKWKNNEPLTEVEWQKNSNGRWLICKDFDSHKMGGFVFNNVIKRGNKFYPQNKNVCSIGIDPFSHSETQDTRRSLGAALAKRKYDPTKLDDPFNDAFFLLYHSRPATTPLFHEDMLMMCWWLGCEALLENNKPAMIDYFESENKNCGEFLMQLSDYTGKGIPGNDKTAERIVDLTETYIFENLGKMYFSLVCQQWVDFDFHNRTAFDVAMAAGYTLIGDHRNTYKTVKNVTKVESLFKKHKINVA